MSEHDFNRTAQVWLEDGPTVMPNRGLSAALEEIHVTRQRRTWWPAQRIPYMHIYARLAIGAAAVAVLAVVGINLLNTNGGIVAGPTASPASSAAAAPLPSPSY